MPEAEEKSPEELFEEWRLENAKRIDAAVRLLGSRKSREDVETTIIEVNFEYRQLLGGLPDDTKNAKKAAHNLSKALDRVMRLTKHKDLPVPIKLFVPIDAIKKSLAQCEKIATTRSSKHTRKNTELKRLAVRGASELLGKHTSATLYEPAGRKLFLKVAALVYGGDEKAVSSQCAAYIREARKKWG